MGQAEELLYLVHRIPYPPNKGDKIRSFNLLKMLCKRFKVHLGAFVDDSRDWQYQKNLNQYCESLMVLPLRSRQAKLRSLSGLLTGEALSLPYYKDDQMQKWVNETVNKHRIKNIMVFSSTMTQYVSADLFRECIRIADFVDIDSDKWLQYSRKKSFPMSWVYAREARLLAQYEQKISKMFQKTLFVSRDEMQYFSDLNPQQATRLDYYNNGVDTDYFDPLLHYNNPYPAEVLPILFTGAMDYWANEEAVCWFLEESLPKILEVLPQVKFYIVGSNPSEKVQLFSQQEGVVVTGSVKDIRPYMRYARVVVAPIRVARGVQNKVLEGMAMARPLVATSTAIEGIELSENYQPLMANSASEFVNQCLFALQDRCYEVPQPLARDCVLQNYNWDSNMEPVLRLFDSVN